MIEVLRPGPLTTVQDAGRAGLRAPGRPARGRRRPAGAARSQRARRQPTGRRRARDDAERAGAPLRRRRGRRARRRARPRAPRRRADRVRRAAFEVARGVDARDRRRERGPAHLPGGPRRDRRSGGARQPLGGHAHRSRARAAARGRRARDAGACARPADPASPGARRAARGRGDAARRSPARARRCSAATRSTCSPTSEYEVAPESSRVGVRFDGAALERRDHGELLSEGLIRGALQVPAAGMPIAMLADHPTTGGYPVIAVVVQEHLPILGQLRPGRRVRFALAQPNEGESR